jgi:hypothetical protein
MKKISAITIMLVFGLAALGGAVGVETRGDGETYGPALAIVAAGDSPDGLTVYSSPSENSRKIRSLPVGAQVKTSVRFSRGWAKLNEPVRGWVKYDHLEAKAGTGEVISVDRPEGCLRIREAPNTHSKIVGCVDMGEELELTGLWTEDNWARVSGPAKGWVWAKQIKSAMAPGAAAKSSSVASKPRRSNRASRTETRSPGESSLFYSEEFFEGRPEREYRGPLPRSHGPAVTISPYVGYGGRNWGVVVGPGGVGGGARFGNFGIGIGF